MECDKNKLTLKYVNSNYNNFLLPNLICLKLIFPFKADFEKELNKLFTLKGICSKIVYLDLSLFIPAESFNCNWYILNK